MILCYKQITIWSTKMYFFYQLSVFKLLQHLNPDVGLMWIGWNGPQKWNVNVLEEEKGFHFLKYMHSICLGLDVRNLGYSTLCQSRVYTFPFTHYAFPALFWIFKANYPICDQTKLFEYEPQCSGNLALNSVNSNSILFWSINVFACLCFYANRLFQHSFYDPYYMV